MCGIGGIISKNGDDVASLVGKMLSKMLNRGPDGVGIAADNCIIQSESIDGLDYSDLRGSNILGHTRLAIVGGTCGLQPFKSCDGKLIVEHNGEIYNYRKIRNKLAKHHRFLTATDSEVIVHLLEDNYNKNNGKLLDAIKETVAELDGIYALAIRDELSGTTALVRDRVGVRQLYYGENKDFVAFASERKPLWAVGIKEPTKRLLPGHAIIISREGRMSAFKIAELPKSGTKTRTYRTSESALRAYRSALIRSIKKRTQDCNRIGIVFSGGIDSVLVAHLANKMVPEVVCYTCGIKDSADIEYSRQIAAKLGFNLQVCELTEEEVEQMIPKVMHVIEEENAGQVEVAIPVYGAVGLAHEQGIRVMLTGQGADELFAGYSWYAKIAGSEGYQKMYEHMVEDLSLLYKETLEREDKITMAHSIELREPFLDIDLIRIAMRIDPRLNVRGAGDIMGKRVHRELALSLGIPHEIAYRVKEAAQHGSGVHSAIDSIARKNGFESVSEEYLQKLAGRERIGSSQRYGHIYENQHIWTAEPHVQMYLDRVSLKDFI